jgi:hypothetical protein
MDESWLNIYRSYTDVALTAEVTKLQGWLDNPFNAQTFRGGESYARSTEQIKVRLEAAIAIQQERTNPQRRIGRADFSGVQP